LVYLKIFFIGTRKLTTKRNIALKFKEIKSPTKGGYRPCERWGFTRSNILI